jgi:prepilin-type N-terminal cleavage/methylation domain-containing protein
MTPRSRGFTLLEVMAAVAILGIVFSVLAETAIQGLRAEGRSARRMEASLLADQRLIDLEIELDAGTPPEEGRQESEEDDYFVVVEVRPFQLPQPPNPEAAVNPAGDEPISEGLQSLREIRITVSWLEGQSEMSVSRTTYGYDAEAFASALPVAGGDANRQLTIDELAEQLPVERR